MLDAVLDELAERIASKLAGKQGETRGWQSQDGSPLGRKHNSIVRARRERGEAGASVMGRRHLLSAEALSEELQRQGKPLKLPVGGIEAELRAELAQLDQEL